MRLLPVSLGAFALLCTITLAMEDKEASLHSATCSQPLAATDNRISIVLDAQHLNDYVPNQSYDICWSYDAEAGAIRDSISNVLGLTQRQR
jgi:hypothetical protein